jgi:hypothetical protein
MDSFICVSCAIDVNFVSILARRFEITVGLGTYFTTLCLDGINIGILYIYMQYSLFILYCYCLFFIIIIIKIIINIGQLD